MSLIVLRVRPDEDPDVITVGDSLSDLENEILGRFEIVPTSIRDVVLIVSSSGYQSHEMPNRIRFVNGEYEMIYGTFLVTVTNGTEFVNLTNEEIAYFTDVFNPTIIEV